MGEFNITSLANVWMRTLTMTMMAEMTMRWSCSVAMEFLGKSGTL